MPIAYFDVIIIGAGAAGLMCAIQAGKRGRTVLVLDHADKLGRKILISGGGRCNFTNRNVSAADFVSENPHFCKSALSRYQPNDFINLVESHHIPYVEKKHGQLFCQRSAQDIVNLLAKECRHAQVTIQLGEKIQRVERLPGKFQIHTHNQTYQSEALVIATGGLSYPQIGASPFGYKLAQQFDLHVVPTRPALDAFCLEEKLLRETKALSGLSLPVAITCGPHTIQEDLLFTHFGLSGPAVLQTSLFWQEGMPIRIDWAPQQHENALLQLKQSKPRQSLKSYLNKLWPKRFVNWFCGFHQLPLEPIAQLSDQQLKEISELMHHWSVTPTRTFGYYKAEVTRGGVSTDEVSSKTFESKKVPGLYFIGEVLDVTGRLGGYNFQWAWASGWCAGEWV